ncbi:MAG: DUF3501 family protein [Actinomycetota bacterium]|nr:DUF3501 family protein [Actinomycetota bacterium]
MSAVELSKSAVNAPRPVSWPKLALEDIADLRAYDRIRDEMRRDVIALKRVRRVQLGRLISIVFENRETVRFQVQEMARAERMHSDAQIQGELDAYNPLIPGQGELSGTLFLEMTSADDLKQWLPRLVGIERAIEILIGQSDDQKEPLLVRCKPEATHEAALTREGTTASVHYIKFELDPVQVEAFASGPVTIRVAHRDYEASVLLGEETRASLLGDLRGSS